jgi:hypothetical protein
MTDEIIEPAIPADLASIRGLVAEAHRDVAARLRRARSERDKLNDRIRDLVVEEREAARAVRALTPKADR